MGENEFLFYKRKPFKKYKILKIGLVFRKKTFNLNIFVEVQVIFYIREVAVGWVITTAAFSSKQHTIY